MAGQPHEGGHAHALWQVQDSPQQQVGPDALGALQVQKSAHCSQGHLLASVIVNLQPRRRTSGVSSYTAGRLFFQRPLREAVTPAAMAAAQIQVICGPGGNV